MLKSIKRIGDTMFKTYFKRTLSVATAIICTVTVGCADVNIDNLDHTNKATKPKGLNIHIIDVGQGESTLLECDNKYMLIDFGESDKGDDVLEYLKKYNVDKLEYAVLTHPHSDHFGGMQEVLQGVDVENIIIGDAYSTTYKWEQLVDYLIDEHKDKVISPKSYDTFKIGDCTLTAYVPYDYEDNLNNASIMLKANYKGMRALLTGDAEKSAEEQAIENGFDVSANVLSAGHHGSSTSTCKTFFEKTNPQLALISCGKDNDYGHPHREITTLFKENNVPYFRTDQQGSIIVNMQDNKISVSTENGYKTEITIDKKRVNTPDSHSTDKQAKNYIGNKNTKIVHKKDCSSINNIKEENKVFFSSYGSALSQGYKLCARCDQYEN